MGCTSCGERRKQAEADLQPREITLPDGTKATVKNQAEARVLKEQAYRRMRAQATQDGYRIRN